ncbi:MAG: ISAs1 family transposase [Acidipropionibacterium sp.]|jgi:predicted transposase YbfD/YdcC|nr:ISAs1 family transposase [Acidipropionibacterium sp.]
MPSSPTAPAVRTSDTPAPNVRLVDHLARVPDPRKPRGTRYPLTGLLLLAISATLAGCRGFTAIGEWAHALTGHSLAGFGLRAAPGESNLRKLFARLDAAALDAELCLYAWTRTTTIDGRRVIAVDGKTLRGSRSATEKARHLVAALDHASGTVVAQQAVEAKSNEIPALPDLITALGERAAGAVITADALHTQTATATAILAAGADYVFTVKANQPGLHKRLKSLPWSRVPAGHVEVEKSHGRRVRRTLKVVQAPENLGFEGAVQVAQLRRVATRKGRKTTEVVYLITSAGLPAAPPARLAAWVRGHWAVENRLHWVRDVTFDEDRHQARTGSAPQVMATLRSVAIGIHRMRGEANIARAIRQAAWDPLATCDLVLTL